MLFHCSNIGNLRWRDCWVGNLVGVDVSIEEFHQIYMSWGHSSFNLKCPRLHVYLGYCVILIGCLSLWTSLLRRLFRERTCHWRCLNWRVLSDIGKVSALKVFILKCPGLHVCLGYCRCSVRHLWGQHTWAFILKCPGLHVCLGYWRCLHWGVLSDIGEVRSLELTFLSVQGYMFA
jgi:hypothetical protein